MAHSLADDSTSSLLDILWSCCSRNVVGSYRRQWFHKVSHATGQKNHTSLGKQCKMDFFFREVRRGSSTGGEYHAPDAGC